MAKQLIYDSEAKEKILAGVSKLEKAVSATLGPCGKNVIIDEFGSIHSTKDGVTVAKAIVLEDPFENLGADAVREVAQKSNDRVGDGTTTSTLLAAAIYRNGLKYVNVGANATQVKNGIKKAADYVAKFVADSAIPAKTRDEIERVATVSANGDAKIGKIIADVMEKIGNDGTVKVENGNALDVTSKIVEGMAIDQSYASPYMATSSDSLEAELDNPWILVANKKISNIKEMIDPLNSIAQSGRPVLIVADDFAEDILGTLILNRMKSGFLAVAVKSPSYGDNRKAILGDIATLCGGQVVSDETGVKLEEATAGSAILGSAKRVVVTRDSTVFIGGAGAPEDVAARVESIRKQIEAAVEDDFTQKKLRDRLAKLTSGVAVVSVGATTKAEQKELRDRVDDAFAASKAAIRSGVVAGGGSALLLAKKRLAKWEEEELFGKLAADEAIGARILFDSLEAPVRKILENAGIDSSLVVAKILESDKPNAGYDVLTKDYADMVEAGVIDPAEVVANEVQNAASVAGLLLTTECLVCDKPDKDKCGCHAPQPPMGGCC